MTWDPPKDFAGITPLGNVPLVLVVSPEQEHQDAEGAGRSRQGEARHAQLRGRRHRHAAAPDHGALPASPPGFTGQLVPFKGAPEALTEIMAGRVDMYFSPLTPALPLIQDGKLLPLAVSSTKRASALPDVPTTLEAGFPNSDFEFWIGSMVRETDATRRSSPRCMPRS